MMIALIRGRAAGKSESLIRWLAEDLDHRVVVTFSAMDAHRLLERCRRLGIEATSRHFVTLEDARTGALRGKRDIELGVDNVDLILQVLFSQHIEVITATGVAV